MALLVLVIVVALVFDFTNGFHDSANAIATSVSTRALSPRLALLMAAVLNMAGAFAGQKVAQTVGKGIVQLPADSQTVVLAALIGAIAWNLITWYFGIPSSSSHALIGGLVGATLIAVGTSGVEWSGIWHKVIVPMVESPVIGFIGAFVLMNILLLIVRRWAPAGVNRWFRRLQPLSAGAVAFAHGSNDAQKTMGVITLALVTTGHLSKSAPMAPPPRLHLGRVPEDHEALKEGWPQTCMAKAPECPMVLASPPAANRLGHASPADPWR